MTKEIIYWSAIALYAAFMLRLMWRQLAEVWEWAEAEQTASLDDWPAQWWWGDE